MKLLLLCLCLVQVASRVVCPDGTLCPEGNTCCSDGTTTQCLTGKQSDGVCCGDGTGCGADRVCSYDENEGKYCAPQLDDGYHDHLPRYNLCSLSQEALSQVYGLSFFDDMPQAAYLSTHGPLNPSNMALKDVDQVLVMVHGSGRNAEDYLCSAARAATSNTLVIAPWFLAPNDPVSPLHNTTASSLRWAEFGPIFHTWRYGADAINDELWEANKRVSAYDVMDRMMDVLLDLVPGKRIVVTGHSAGGQYTQRWALLSNHHIFQRKQLRVVVVNPRSFCFLDERRWVDGEFVVPDTDCDWYNEWEWGFGPGRDLVTPYKDMAIEEAGGIDPIVARYPNRDIVYLAGEQDVIPNGDCQDKLQGNFRRVRSENFVKALKEIYGKDVHRRLVVKGVPHDHTLMYQSEEGQAGLWGEALQTNEQSTSVE